MSTKTTFKRIALVAVAALGLGTVSVAPSSAAVLVGSATNTLAMVSSSTTITAGDTATATFTSTFVGQAAYDSVAVAAYTTTTQAPQLRLGVSESSTSVEGNLTVTGGSLVSQSTSAAVGVKAAGSATVTYKIHVYAPTVAGTYSVSIYATPYSATGAGTTYTTPLTWTFTVTAQDKVPTANSTVTLRSGYNTTTATPFGGTTEGTDSSTALTSSKSILGTAPAATLFVVQKNAAGTAGESVTAIISGPGYISTSGTTRPTSGTSLTLPEASAGTKLYVWSTGDAGTATVTLSTPSLALGTKTVKFFGAAAKVAVSTAVATSKIAYTKAGSSTTAAVIVVTDANGNAVTNLAATDFTVTSSDKLQIASGSVAAYSTTYGGYVLTTTSAAGTSGKTSVITVAIADPADTAGVKTLSTTVTLTMGGAVAKEVISFDKSSYSPGEQMIITITATDAAGNAAYDAAAPALSSNKTIQGLANVATSYTGGKADSVSRDTDGSVLNSYRVYAPATAGEFVVTATGTDAAATLISAKATVSDATIDAATDAANEATDAANAATDAALAAADAADAATAAAQDASDAVAALSATVAKLVASLKAQITSLTNLVIKIQKKVRA